MSCFLNCSKPENSYSRQTRQDQADQARPGRPGKTRQTKQDQARPGKTREDQARPGKSRQEQARPGKTREDQARPGKSRMPRPLFRQPLACTSLGWVQDRDGIIFNGNELDHFEETFRKTPGPLGRQILT